MTKPRGKDKKPASLMRLILGDQLNAAHSWYKNKDDGVLYVIAELHQEMAYVKHHIQKVCAFFLAMEQFASALKASGHRVLHLTLDDTQGDKSLTDLLLRLCHDHKCQRLEYQQPDEYRLRHQLEHMSQNGILQVSAVESEHFLLDSTELADYFTPNKAVRMESFYRKMRRRFNVLMCDKEPEGGQWNFDKENRKKLKPDQIAQLPEPLTFANDASAVLQRLERHEVQTFGEVADALPWPMNRRQVRQLLRFFCDVCLGLFGDFQDAMTRHSEARWSLYHSRLSFALNSKMISPGEVIQQVQAAYHQRDDLPISAVEGFVRQILGWREYVRGIYWLNMPEYARRNALSAVGHLPEYFWHGETNMRCMRESLGQSLQYSYAHHIQRLMVIGNFCVLTGRSVDEVDQWYLGVYIDAIEWVELPNTRGMSQYGDGGLIASKPYVSGGAYINRMSDYCSGCHYDVKDTTGTKACPFNSFYWYFLHKHRQRFANNPRLAMAYRNWDKKDDDAKRLTLSRAEHYIETIETL